MNKEDAHNRNLSLNGSVSHFLNHAGNYSEVQVTEFLKSIYAASQERIAKGRRLVANDAYPDEGNLDEVIEKF